MSTIIVFVEHQNGAVKRASLEALGAASSCGAEVIAVLQGSDAAAAANGALGAARAITLGGDAYSPDACAAAVAGIIKECGAKAFLASATSTGRDLAPRVAALVDSTLFSDCTELSAEGDSYTIKRPWLAGKLMATVLSKAPVTCATLRRNVFPAAEGAAPAEVTGGADLGAGKCNLTGIEAKASGRLDVSEAPVVISGGRGLKEAENFKIIEDLAEAFGNAAVGASRAVVDAGWRPHSEQVGQTGKTVAPQLYVAVGISGAIQHLAGMKTSQVIVAINKDADAPIFKVADYGIVGDANEVLGPLTAEVKRIKAQG